MTIVITKGMVLSTVGDMENPSVNAPVVGWQNLVRFNAIVAESEQNLFPVVNIGNPSTASIWKSNTTIDQTVTFTFDEVTKIDYVGIVRHNLSSAGVNLTIEVLIGSDWTPVVGPVVLADDGPTILRFGEVSVAQARLVLSGALVNPQIAVVYVGALLRLQRNIYVGHTPINYGREIETSNGMAESGDFLGRIITRESKSTDVTLANMTPSWFRSRMNPFLVNAKNLPFFFSWRPASYPREVGYAWLRSSPRPSNQRSNGMMQVQLSMGGIAGDEGFPREDDA